MLLYWSSYVPWKWRLFSGITFDHMLDIVNVTPILVGSYFKLILYVASFVCVFLLLDVYFNMSRF